MKDILVKGAFVVTGIALSWAFWLVYMNRASEKVISGALPIALAAIVGVFLTIFVFADEPAVSRAFPVTFFYAADSGAPISPPFRRNHNDVFLVARLLKETPGKANDGTQGMVLYHHLLQKALFEWIVFRHAGAWDSEHLSFDFGGKLQQSDPVRGRAEPSVKRDRAEIEKILSGNWFAKDVMMPVGITLPMGTDIIILPPSIDSEIRFTHPVCTLTITTTPSSWGVGIGAYHTFTPLSMDESQKFYKHATYVVRAVVSFNRYRIGDPRLPLIKRWANQIIDGLQNEFDEQIIWREARDNFILNQQSGPGGLASQGQVYGFSP